MVARHGKQIGSLILRRLRIKLIIIANLLRGNKLPVSFSPGFILTRLQPGEKQPQFMGNPL